ncbi:MAG: hypothetical protein IH988_02995 [Planctomycetes bacterium]|nr:hypothetical protein [Planctomycetota bacterium]
MKPVTLYVLTAVLVWANLQAQPAWAQKRGYDGDGRERGEVTPAKEKSKLEQRYAEFSKAMAWELKTGKEQSDQIQIILKQFRPQRDSVGHDAALNAQTRDLRAAFRRANKSNDRQGAAELRYQISELERKANPLATEMFYAIADVLVEPLLTDYWRIASRFTDSGKIITGALYIELLDGLELTEEQGVSISLHYKTYLGEMRQADNDSPDLREAVEASFLSRLLDELNEKQQATFKNALETRDTESERTRGETSGRW